MIELRPFQEKGIVKVRDSLSRNKRVVLCSPTGSGKTYMSCELIRLAKEKHNTSCFLVHRQELLKQSYESLIKFDILPEVISSKSKNIQPSNVYLGMVETFYRRVPKIEFLSKIDLFILDECHSSVYYKIIKQFPKSFVVGLSASPQSSSQTEPLNKYYEDIIELSTVEDLIKDKYLCPAKTYSINIDEEKKKLKKKGKDFSEESQLEFFHTPKLYEGDIENYSKICPDKKFIAYCVNVEHSKETAKKFTKEGYPCKHIDGNTPEAERNLILSQLKSGEIKGVSNFGIVTSGYDEDSIECIIQNFATSELSKHIQTAGRGARIKPGKNHFIILDMGGNFARHGLWNSNRDWTDIFNNPSGVREKERQKEEDKHNLMCEGCGYILTIKEEECPYCHKSATESLKEKAKKVGPTKLKEIRQELKSRIPTRLRKQTRSMSKSELFEYADLMGYKKSWAFTMLSLRAKSFSEKFRK